MKRAFLLVAFISATALVSAQAPDFSGTYQLDRDASRITAQVGLTGLHPAGVPDRIHVTHAANGTVVIGSEVNGSRSRAYHLGGVSEIPAGRDAMIEVTTRLDGARITAEGRMAQGSSATALRETLTLDASGRTLTVDVLTTTAQGEQQTTLVYRKADTAAPCTAWPTPCR